MNQHYVSVESPNYSIIDSSESSYENDIEGEAKIFDNGAVDTFQSMLAKWVARNQISNIATNELLKLMRSFGHNNLPNDVRTLLNTRRSIEVKFKCGGEYICFGLQKCILTNLIKISNKYKIDLVVNIDGLLLFKSSSVQIWPILYRFSKLPPFSVATFCGNAKLSSEEELLEDFLEELTSLCLSGVKHAGKNSPSSVYFCCGAPERQFLKSIIRHNGYNASKSCEIRGQYIIGRVTFEGLEYPLSTDIGFNLCNYKEHQKILISLSRVNLSCTSGFVLDIIHLVYLGAVKRILTYLYEGPNVSRIAPAQRLPCKSIFYNLMAKCHLSLAEFKQLKATEFKNFLLYTAIVVLKDIVSHQIYHHSWHYL